MLRTFTSKSLRTAPTSSQDCFVSHVTLGQEGLADRQIERCQSKVSILSTGIIDIK